MFPTSRAYRVFGLRTSGVLDITPEMGSAPPSYENTLAALEYIDFPSNISRKNVLKSGSRSHKAMCLGAVRAWRTNSFGFAGGVAGGNGLIMSGHIQGRSNIARLLAGFAAQACPGFTFTSIQVNKNYESDMHCDKNNLGPSLITGLGEYSGGKLWGQEIGAVDLHKRWVTFDRNVW